MGVKYYSCVRPIPGRDLAAVCAYPARRRRVVRKAAISLVVRAVTCSDTSYTLRDTSFEISLINEPVAFTSFRLCPGQGHRLHHSKAESELIKRTTKTRKGPAAASRPVGEAGGARRDDDDLSYKNHLAHPSTSLALGN